MENGRKPEALGNEVLGGMRLPQEGPYPTREGAEHQPCVAFAKGPCLACAAGDTETQLLTPAFLIWQCGCETKLHEPRALFQARARPALSTSHQLQQGRSKYIRNRLIGTHLPRSLLTL